MLKNSEKVSVAFLYDDTIDNNDGVAQYVKTLGAWLSARGHQVTYLVGESNTRQWAGGQVISLSKNIRVVFNGNRLSMPLYSKKRIIKKTLVENKFDVIHVQVPYSPFMAGRVIKLAPANIAMIGTFHILPAGFLSSAGSRLLRLILLGSSKKFDKLFATSPPAAEFAKSAYGMNCQVLPNAVSLKKFINAQQSQPGTIVFLGRLVPRKGCLQLIKAFALLKKEIPDAKLIVGGNGPQRPELERYVTKNEITDVEFAGFVREEDKPSFLAQAQVACFPSLYGESFGIVLIEAMAAGAGVVVGGNNPGYASVLGERKELLINPKDVPAFAERLKLLLEDKKLAAELHAWQTQAVRQYDVNVVGSKLLDIYRSSIDIKNKNGHNKT